MALRGAADVDADYLEAPDGQLAWAAAAVAAAVDDPTISVPEEVSNWLGRHGEARPREMRGLGLQALQRVLAEKSELVELWREAGEENAWRASVQKVAAALT